MEIFVEREGEMKIPFEMDEENGYCLTPCPYNKGCFINSMACSRCVYYFGEIKNESVIRCTGHRIT